MNGLKKNQGEISFFKKKFIHPVFRKNGIKKPSQKVFELL
jgi:hypothetical protein